MGTHPAARQALIQMSPLSPTSNRPARRGSAFVVVPPATDVAPAGPIVCVVDASSAARRAAGLACAVAAEVGAPLVLAHAVSGAELDHDDDGRVVDVRARLATRHRVAANVRRVLGDRPIELVEGGLEIARERDARLLIVVDASSLSVDACVAARCPVVVMSAPVGGDSHMPC
jgi:hypothetical protein